MSNQEWEIKPRASACQLCQKPFENGQVYISNLRVGTEQYERTDSCVDCGKEVKDDGKIVSTWRGKFHVEPPPQEVLKKETAETLLRKLIEKNEPRHLNSIFILAVMLERRRLLAEKEVQKQEDYTMVRVYEHRHTGETFIIRDPMLSLDQLGSVQQEVALLLSGSEEMPVAEQKSVDAQVQGSEVNV